jgi:hypothetical protein
VNWQDISTGGGCQALAHDLDDGGYLMVTGLGNEDENDIPYDLHRGVMVGYYTRDKGEGHWAASIGQHLSWTPPIVTVQLVDAILSHLNRKHEEIQMGSREARYVLPNLSKLEMNAVLTGLRLLQSHADNEYSDLVTRRPGPGAFNDGLQSILTDGLPEGVDVPTCAQLEELIQRINCHTTDV